MVLAAILMAALVQDDSPVRAFLERRCAECHGGGKSKGEFRLDQLSSTLQASDGSRSRSS